MNFLRLCVAGSVLAIAACASMQSTDTQRPPSAGASIPAPVVAPAPPPAPVADTPAPVAAPVVVPETIPIPAPVPVAAPKPATAPPVAAARKPAAAVETQPARHVAATTPPAPKPAASPTLAGNNSLSGHIELVVGAGQSVEGDEITEAAVYFIPDNAAPLPKPGKYQIYTKNKHFDPASLVIPVGSTVVFPNQDEILHNVFSVSPNAEFDLGLYGENASGSYTFKKAGLAVINCNVHRGMQANVLVLDTPYFTTPSKSGDYRLTGLPAGSGKLVLWHPRAVMQSTPLAVPQSGPVDLRLAITKLRISQHLNKERKPYQPDRN